MKALLLLTRRKGRNRSERVIAENGMAAVISLGGLDERIGGLITDVTEDGEDN
jgi:hypothetical protein